MVNESTLNHGKCGVVHTLRIKCLLAPSQGNGHLSLAFLDPDDRLGALFLVALLVGVVRRRLVVLD